MAIHDKEDFSPPSKLPSKGFNLEDQIYINVITKLAMKSLGQPATIPQATCTPMSASTDRFD